MKEDLVPAEADARLFRAAPYLAFLGLFLTFIVLPFSRYAIVADLDVGLLFLVSVTSLVVVSIIMGGWSSNSKWSLLGGMRSAAQIVSYELPASLALVADRHADRLALDAADRRAPRAAGPGSGTCSPIRSPSSRSSSGSSRRWPRATARRSICPRPSRSWWRATTPSTRAFASRCFRWSSGSTSSVIGAVGTLLFLGGWRLPFIDAATLDAHRWLDAAAALPSSCSRIWRSSSSSSGSAGRCRASAWTR